MKRTRGEKIFGVFNAVMMILFMALFVVAGVGLMVYAVILWKKGMAEEKEEKKTHEEEDGLK